MYRQGTCCPVVILTCPRAVSCSPNRMRNAARYGGHDAKGQTVDRLTVPLIVVTSRTEAELIAGLLSSNGLRAVVSADDAGARIRSCNLSVCACGSPPPTKPQLAGSWPGRHLKGRPAREAWVTLVVNFESSLVFSGRLCGLDARDGQAARPAWRARSSMAAW